MSYNPSARVQYIVGRRLHRIVRMHLEGKLTASQATELTAVAEDPGYAQTIHRLLVQFPGCTYGEALMESSRVPPR